MLHKSSLDANSVAIYRIVKYKDRRPKTLTCFPLLILKVTDLYYLHVVSPDGTTHTVGCHIELLEQALSQRNGCFPCRK